MKIHSNKRLAAVGLGVGAFGLVVASAATLGGLTNEDMGASAGVVSSCDSDGVTLDYSHTYSSTSGTYEVDSVTVSGIDVACDGQTVEVTLRNSLNAAIGSGSATVGGTTQAVSISAGAISENVTGSAVVISG